MPAEEAFDHVGVERVGVDDEIGTKLPEEFGHGVFSLGDEGKGFAEILPIGRLIDPGPEFGGVGGNFPVGSTEEPVDDGVSQVAGVCDLDHGLVLKCFRQVPGRAVVAISEAGGEDQDLGLHVGLGCEKM